MSISTATGKIGKTIFKYFSNIQTLSFITILMLISVTESFATGQNILDGAGSSLKSLVGEGSDVQTIGYVVVAFVSLIAAKGKGIAAGIITFISLCAMYFVINATILA